MNALFYNDDIWAIILRNREETIYILTHCLEIQLFVHRIAASIYQNIADIPTADVITADIVKTPVRDGLLNQAEQQSCRISFIISFQSVSSFKEHVSGLILKHVLSHS